MKKLLMLVFLLAFLCGCAEEKEETIDRNNRKNVSSERLTSTPEPTQEPTPTEALPGWSITYVTATPRPTATNTPVPTPTMIPYVAMEEILMAEEFSGKVQIMDTVFQFPCRLKEIMALEGLLVEQSQYSSLSGYDPLNDTYGSESNNDLHVVFPDGSEAWLVVENLSLNSLPMEELYVTELVSESPCIFFPKGVSVGTHCSVLKEWREHDSLVPGSSVACYIYQEVEYVADYSTLDLGAEFEIDVNNTTYNIDEVKYTPAFYVSMDFMTEMIQTNYPADLKYRVPIVLRKGWRTGLIVHEGKRYVVSLDESYMYENPETREELLAALGRTMEYYDEKWESWYYWIDTSDTTNEKIVVKEDEVFYSVVNFWDYSDCAGKESIQVGDKQLRPRKEAWKLYADLAMLSGNYVDFWSFTVEALDQGEIPEEVRNLFRDVVLAMAESVEEMEE